MKAKKKLIVFGIDGTVTDSVSIHERAFLDAMESFGIRNVNLNWPGYKYPTDSYIFKANYETYFDRNLPQGILDTFEDVMVDKLLHHSGIDEVLGAREFVQYAWNETEYAIVFATGSLVKPAIIKLVEASIPFTKELVVGSNNCYSKEDIVVKAIDTATKYYGVEEFEHVISVGDCVWDLITARNLNLSFLGIGENNRSEFEQLGAKSLVNDFSKLV